MSGCLGDIDGPVPQRTSAFGALRGVNGLPGPTKLSPCPGPPRTRFRWRYRRPRTMVTITAVATSGIRLAAIRMGSNE
jgi:hypothetical protein